MATPFDGRGHLVRAAALFAAGFAAFLMLRSLLVPEGFGVYGHFRAQALDDNRARPVVFAGRGSCGDCHSDAADVLHAGSHRGVGCEACHGPLARHAEDAAAQKAERPDPRGLCLHCHEKGPAKPTGFAQVAAAEHAPEGACTECHRAHAPKVE